MMLIPRYNGFPTLGRNRLMLGAPVVLAVAFAVVVGAVGGAIVGALISAPTRVMIT